MKGISQGDPLSNNLFTLALGRALSRLNWGCLCISIIDIKLNNLKFADDVVIIAANLSQLNEILNGLY